VISPFFQKLRRTCAPVLATLLVTLSVLVPLLDRGERVGRPTWEAEHDAATCVRGHDHTICTQFRANHPVLSDAPRHGTVPPAVVALRPLVDEIVIVLASSTPHHSRAPPLG